MTQAETVVITGASGGVGRATARLFGSRCARVALLARGRAGLDAAADEIKEHGGEALVVQVDVADAAQLAAAAEQIVQQWGHIDIWINCAMATMLSPFMDMTSEEYRRITEVTYLGYVYGTYEALRWMRPRNRGVIVQVGSSLAYRGIPLQSAYCGAKHAVRGFTDSVRCELLHEQSSIRLSMVQLPAVNTPQFLWSKNNMPRKHQPVPPIFQPEVCADAIAWAAHHHPRELYVGISTRKAIWAHTFFPGLIDRYLGATGYDSQQTNEPEDHTKRHNLWEPMERDYGAHGPFDTRAIAQSRLLQWEKIVRLPVVAVSVVVTEMVSAMVALKRRCQA